MIQNIPVAVGLAVIGSFSFALAARIQHSAVTTQVAENRAKRRLNLKQLYALLHDRVWWMGSGVLAVATLCQVGALAMAPVAVVQPVNLLAFPWAVVLARKSLGAHPGRTIVPTLVTVAATFGFILLVARFVGAPTRDLSVVTVGIAAAAVYAVVVAFAGLGSRWRRRWRCLFWASGGALLYGLEAFVVRALFMYAAENDGWWRAWYVWVAIVALIVGSGIAGVMIQQAYATGPTPVVVATATVSSPIAAVLSGMFVLGEGRHLPFVAGGGLIGLGAVAIAGVIILARSQAMATEPGAE